MSIPIISLHKIKLLRFSYKKKRVHIRFTANFDLRPCQVKDAAYILYMATHSGLH